MADVQQPNTQQTAQPVVQSTAQPAAAQPQAAPKGKYKVTVLRDKCISAASCIAVAPKVFQFDNEQKAIVISEDELDDIKLLAAQSCPTAAIVVTNIETGEQVWPK